MSYLRQQGAGEISKYLLSTFGDQVFAFIVDEGGMFFSHRICILSHQYSFCRELPAVIWFCCSSPSYCRERLYRCSLVSGISWQTLQQSSKAHCKNCDSIFFEWIIDNSMHRASAFWLLLSLKLKPTSSPPSCPEVPLPSP